MSTNTSKWFAGKDKESEIRRVKETIRLVEHVESDDVVVSEVLSLNVSSKSSASNSASTSASNTNSKSVRFSQSEVDLLALKYSQLPPISGAKGQSTALEEKSAAPAAEIPAERRAYDSCQPSKPLSPPMETHDLSRSRTNVCASSSGPASTASQPIIYAKALPDVPSKPASPTSKEMESQYIQMKAKVNQVQGQLQQAEYVAKKFRNLASHIVELERKVCDPPSQLCMIQSILDFCLDKGLSGTAKALQAEAPEILSARGSQSNEQADSEPSKRTQLSQYLINHQFDAALWMIQEAMKRPASGKHRASKESFDDLLYIINKYYFLDMIERAQYPTATQILQQIIYPHVHCESLKGDDRATWFMDDYRFLSEILQMGPGYSHNNTYLHWEWNRELETFWSAPAISGTEPLYMSALNSLFPEDTQRSRKQCDPEKLVHLSQVVKLEDAVKAHSFRVELRKLVDSSALFSERESQPIAAAADAGLTKSSVPSDEKRQIVAKKASASASASNTTLYDETLNFDNSQATLNSKQIADSSESVQPVLKKSGAKKVLGPVQSNYFGHSTSIGSDPSLTLVDDSRSSRGSTRSHRRELDDCDRRSSSSSFTPPSLPSEFEKLMPYPPKELETANFGLSTVCGPVTGHIRAMDVQPKMNAGRIVVATAGGDERNDRKISIWDVKKGNLITQLDNGTHKPVLALTFHPDEPHLLLTADMEFNVKLWNWTTGEIIRTWKKHHSRVIWKVAFIPGRPNFAASCSGDQIIKIWDTSLDTPQIGSVHANEPFTSFVFCGDSANQTIVASLSQSIRLYKVRTLALTLTIPLPELKKNNTKITSIVSHPVHSNYILISCDNQLRLFDLVSETMLRTYSTRELSPGMRIEGNFSPCGTFVYANSCDIRSLPAATHASQQQQAQHQNRRSSIASLSHMGDDKSLSMMSNSSSNGTFLNGLSSDFSSTHVPNPAAPDAKGVYVWRVATGKLEVQEMRAMEYRVPVTVCKWIKIEGVDRGGSRNGARKAMVAASVQGTVKLFL
ncbi:Nucleoporin Nup43 [Chytriomyces hyalinus]|nr:Nucleoporin Nup43 [Chytriomyces hyalinus]